MLASALRSQVSQSSDGDARRAPGSDSYDNISQFRMSGSLIIAILQREYLT